MRSPHPLYPHVRRLATSGLVEVLLASSDATDEDVIIKRLLPNVVADEAVRGRILEQAALSQRFDHPGLVTVLEVQDNPEEPFFVEEYVGGPSLAELRKDGRSLVMPGGIACRVIANTAASLEHAFLAHGRVHGALRPSKILIGSLGGPRIADFGLAHADPKHRYIKAGMLKTLYAYQSPEELQGEAVDAQSQVFSLGVILWELLTGRPMFSGRSPARVKEQVLNEEIFPPSIFAPAIPEGLDDVVMQALARDRALRTPSPGDFAGEIEACFLEHKIDVDEPLVAKWLRSVLPEWHQEREALEDAIPFQFQEDLEDADEEPPPVLHDSDVVDSYGRARLSAEADLEAASAGRPRLSTATTAVLLLMGALALLIAAYQLGATT